MAIESYEAASMLTVERWRAMANRIYYALFAEVHSRLIAAGVRPRRLFGTWSHEALPGLVRRHLVKTLGLEDAHELSQTDRFARQVREIADYRPGMMVDANSVLSARTRAHGWIGELP